uniref:Uncharacterized protein n=1 Tax=Helianthus annuus TaxID=4232 RepID=A0A251SHP6_HELAN
MSLENEFDVTIINSVKFNFKTNLFSFTLKIQFLSLLFILNILTNIILNFGDIWRPN